MRTYDGTPWMSEQRFSRRACGCLGCERAFAEACAACGWTRHCNKMVWIFVICTSTYIIMYIASNQSMRTEAPTIFNTCIGTIIQRRFTFHITYISCSIYVTTFRDSFVNNRWRHTQTARSWWTIRVHNMICPSIDYSDRTRSHK